MYWAGVSLLGIAAFLLGLFSHKLFFGDGHSVGYVNFDGIYYGAQWTGFWCAVLSLALFALAAWLAPFPLLSRRALAPAIALALCVHFLAFSIPEASNRHTWKEGAVGWSIYVETKRRIWTEQRADAKLKGTFDGKWTNPEGARLQIKPDLIRLAAADAAMEFSDATCADYPDFRYQMANRHEVGYHFYRAGRLMSPLYRDLPEGLYPLLTYTCNGRDAAFMVLGPRRLVAVLYDGSLMTFAK